MSLHAHARIQHYTCTSVEQINNHACAPMHPPDGWNALGNDGELPDEILAKKDKDGLTDGDRFVLKQSSQG